MTGLEMVGAVVAVVMIVAVGVAIWIGMTRV